MSSKCCCCKNKSTIEDAEKKLAKIKADESEKRRQNRKKWLSKQYLPVEAAVTAVDGAFLGAVPGVILSLVYKGVCNIGNMEAFIDSAMMGATVIPQSVQMMLSSTGGYQPLVRSFILGGTLEHVRNFAVLKGVSEGISCVMRRLGSKEDVHAKMVTSFGSGVMLSLVSGMRGPDVISTGVMLALVNGGIFKLREKSSQRKAEEEVLTRRRGMFLSIGFGLDHVAMNFKTGLSAATTRPMLTKSKGVIMK